MQDCVWVYRIIFNNLLVPCWNWQASSSTDGKLKMWVYGVAAGAFVLLIFIVSMIYLAWWVDEFNLPCLSSPSFMKPPLFLSPPTLSWSTPFTSLSSFFLLHVRAVASVPRCITHLRPKSLTPTGRRRGQARTHMRWFTSVLNAKSWLKTAVVNDDVEGSAPTPTCLPHSPWISPRALEKCPMFCLTIWVKVQVRKYSV